MYSVMAGVEEFHDRETKGFGFVQRVEDLVAGDRDGLGAWTRPLTSMRRNFTA